MTLFLLSSFFFFFQAEDGIRDHCVTGVQTCALPICDRGRPGRHRRVLSARRVLTPAAAAWVARWLVLELASLAGRRLLPPGPPPRRSEERRVGKGCRWRGWPEQCSAMARVADHAAAP